ncbi:hypothetical protein GAY28_16335 [Azospirillum brasilense]|nr:hypothetical protein [Azospirillum brasilense]
MTGRYLTPNQRAVARFIRADCAFINVQFIAFIIGRSRQQVHNIVVSAGIIPGGGAEAQDDKLKAAYERDMGKKLSTLEWSRMKRLIEQEAADQLVRLLPRPEPNPEMDRAMAELTANLKNRMEEWK